MKRLLLAIALLLGLADVAAAQNVTCATRPVTDNSNACANTAFVNSVINSPSSPIYTTAHTWSATQTFSPVSGTAVALNGTLTMYGDVVLTHPLTPTPDNTASSNITLGVGAGAALAPIHSTQYLTLLGFQAGAALTTEDHITAVGAWSLSSYNAGGTNTGITAIGIDAMRNLTSGQQNVAVGEHTLTGATSASYTTAVGYNTMLNFGAGGTYNSAFGYFALGGSSGTPATGLGNTALGSYALVGIAGTGAYNTAVGMQALYAVAQANGNVGIGYQAGLTVTTGYANTIIGTFAGSATLATGHDNILIGTTNNVADTPLSSTSNYLNIGNFIYGTSAGLTISPITTTSLTSPLIVGGSGTGTQLVLKTTSGIGTTDSLAIVGGNNGTTNFATFTASGLTIPATIVAGQFAPSGAGAPANGMYLPAANTIGFTTNSTERLRIDSNGDITATSDTFLLTSKSTGASAHSLPQIAMRSNENPGASGVGGHLRYQVYSSTGVLRDAVQLNGGLIDVTNGAENGDLDILVYRAGTADVALAVRGDWASIAPGSSNTWSLGRSANTWKDGFFSGTIYANTHTADGTAARTWSMTRNTTAATAGQNLTIQAGGAVSGGTDLVGGNIILSGGTSTGSGGAAGTGSAVLFYAAPSAGSSGTGDVAPVETMRIMNVGGYGFLTFQTTNTSAYAIAGHPADPVTYFNGLSGMNMRISNVDRFRLTSSLAQYGIPAGDPNVPAGATVHIGTGAAAAPALSSCGTSPSIVGTDTAGEVTMGTGSPTACTITFNVAYVSAPYCVVTWQANPLAAQNYSVSTSAITIGQTATSSNKVNYHCIARAGG